MIVSLVSFQWVHIKDQKLINSFVPFQWLHAKVGLVFIYYAWETYNYCIAGPLTCGFPSQWASYAEFWCLIQNLYNNCLLTPNTLINSLGPSDAIWSWRSWSTLVQVKACCLTAPSHYLNQCWLIISKVLWHSPEDIIIRRFEETNQ